MHQCKTYANINNIKITININMQLPDVFMALMIFLIFPEAFMLPWNVSHTHIYVYIYIYINKHYGNYEMNNIIT